ncbi:hypothetical protein E2C01_034785 [Portunus trituberculatus]|uniref:Uncharacterized protein n=1 Tax=Portunus trituberculatus TaxID=210409 RepID=A0A5B7F7V2_PORTR|nr:hypothetical protein [Portunus trituberculatus]
MYMCGDEIVVERRMSPAGNNLEVTVQKRPRQALVCFKLLPVRLLQNTCRFPSPEVTRYRPLHKGPHTYLQPSGLGLASLPVTPSSRPLCFAPHQYPIVSTLLSVPAVMYHSTNNVWDRSPP